MKYALFLTMLLGAVACTSQSTDIVVPDQGVDEKIHGVSLEMPATKIEDSLMAEVSRVNAEWVAMIPYGYTLANEAVVRYDEKTRYWWGESVEGAVGCIEIAQRLGYKTMLKPHVWVLGQGWPGDFDLKKESDWQAWEKSYREYILRYAHIADSMNVDLLCIGTEYRKAVVKREQFWRDLIVDVKKIYDGPLTYAANWDNYEKVGFWSELDFIGIDAYFPLSNERQPTLEESKKSWDKVSSELGRYSQEAGRPILFTEFGYKSIDYGTSGYWNYNEDTVAVNMENQQIAYQSLFETIWQKDWMAGGFFWKWHLYSDEEVAKRKKGRYSPQGKPAEAIIREYYRGD